MSTPEPAGRRGRRPLLSAERVLDAAEVLLDAEGLDAVSFRRLSTELGVSHMTLYGYFESKAALLEALVERTISLPSVSAPATGGWEAALLATLEGIHRALVGRPGIAELLVSHQLTTDHGLRAREELLDFLRAAGFTERQAVDGISILFNYVLGAAMIAARRGPGGSPQSFRTGLGYLVSGLKADPP